MCLYVLTLGTRQDEKRDSRDREREEREREEARRKRFSHSLVCDFHVHFNSF
jgi:hypothetical protein